MSNLQPDIIKEMKTRFGSDFETAHKILTEQLINHEYLNTDRFIRCIIFLSDNGIESLKMYLESAKTDPRDVMWWAEYERPENATDNSRKIRDFSKTFEENAPKN